MNFPITQFLREIDIGDSKSAKYAILTHLQALHFDFYEFFHLLKDDILKVTKFKTHETAKKGSFNTSRLSKIDLSDRKILKFSHCVIILLTVTLLWF